MFATPPASWRISLDCHPRIGQLALLRQLADREQASSEARHYRGSKRFKYRRYRS